jgi:1,4-dihydroxy-2-naphthoate octaprenyltransferase
MANVKAWLGAMRLRTLPLAASVVLTGSTSSLNSEGFSWMVFALTLTTTFLLQILSNLANDYGDFKNGADNHGRVGPARAVQSGEITPEQMKNAMAITAVLSLLSGVILLYSSLAQTGYLTESILFLTLGLSSIAAAVKYTAGKNPYGYRGLGDLFVFVFFGMVGVMGTSFLQTKEFTSISLLNALVIGGLSTAVLNLNNLRDHVNDKAAGKMTLVVKMGFEKGKQYLALLVGLSSISALFVSIYIDSYFGLLAFIIPIARLFKIFGIKEPQSLDPELKKFALSALIYGVIQLVVFIV